LLIPVKGFLETTFIDWPGKIAAAVFLPGCNFRCPFCHNGELVTAAAALPEVDPEEVFGRIAELEWVDGLVVSGGEPTLQPGLVPFLRECARRGLPVKLDTNGSRPGLLGGILAAGLLAAVDMDVKAPLDEKAYAGMAGTGVVLEDIRRSIGLIAASGLPHRFRTTVVPGMIGREEVLRIREALPAASPLHLQAFDPRRTLDERLGEKTRKPTGDEMKALRRLAAAA
jgi:pyruvate formate lyase activating enzyme